MAAEVPYPVTVEMAFGADPDGFPSGWTWTDLGHDPRRSPVTISRGRSDESSQVQPSTVDVLLANSDGRYTPNNPTSPHWPNVRRGTPMRVSVDVDEVRYTRFVGHVASWEPSWPMATDADDPHRGVSHVRVTAAGMLRRLGQGGKRLHSPLRRLATAPVNLPYLLAYWPCEDGRHSLRAVSPLDGVEPMIVGDPAAFASAPEHPGSEPLLHFSSGSGGWNGTVPPGPDLVQWRCDWFARLDTDFLTGTEQFDMMLLRATGTAARWQIAVLPTPGPAGTVAIGASDGDGGFLLLDVFAPGEIFGHWTRWSLELIQDGFDTVWRLRWSAMSGPDEGIIWAPSGSFGGGIGRPSSAEALFADAPPGGVSIGHIVFSTQRTLSWLTPANIGWRGERSAVRFSRLCSEERVPVQLVGDFAGSEPMGIQRAGDFLGLLDECTTAEGGMMGEQVTAPGLVMRTRGSLVNQAVAVDASMSSRQLRHPFTPTLDDRSLANTITVSRPDASEHIAIDPDHVQAEGEYSDSATINVDSDEQAMQHAWWRLHLGTWPEMRWTGLALRPIGGGLVADWVDTRPGDRLIARDLPRQQHGDVDALIQGWSETLTGFDWRVEPNTSPAGPWTVGVLDADGTPDTDLDRLASDGTGLVSAVTDTETSWDLLTVSGPPWVDSTSHGDQFPLDLSAGGEVVTCTAITAAAPEQVPAVRAADDFDRTVADGWSASTSGAVWQLSHTADTAWSVSGDAGRVDILSVAAGLPSASWGPVLGDSEVLLSFSVSQLAGDELAVSAALRSDGQGGFYQVLVSLLPDGSISMFAGRPEAIVDTASPAVTYAADDVLWLRARADEENRVRGRVWADVDPEPVAWDVDGAIGTPSFGPVRVDVSALEAADVGAQYRVHSIELIELLPGGTQTATVTRSVNDVSKPHDAGTQVEPAAPFRLAL